MKKVLCQSTNTGATRAWAAKLIATLTDGGLLLLTGELGAGKTTFVQGLAAALQVTARVTSPTFTLLKVYAATHSHIHQLVHIDLYRLPTGANPTELDISTWLKRPHTLIVVEWPERAAALWPKPIGTIHFQLGKTMQQRSLAVSGQIATVFATVSGSTE